MFSVPMQTSDYDGGYSTETMYCNLIHYLGKDELIELLRKFGFDLQGNKTELCKRATEILKYKPIMLDYQKYQEKIVEMFNIIQHDTPNCNAKSEDDIFFLPKIYDVFNIIFKSLPFYRMVSRVIRRRELIDKDTQYIAKDFMNQGFTFYLTYEQSKYIMSNKKTTHDNNILSRENEYLYQLQIRFCQFRQDSIYKTDRLPLGLSIQINNEVCLLPPITHGHHTQIQARLPMPIDCTQYVIVDPRRTNEMNINWTNDGSEYIMEMCLVKKLSSDILLSKFLWKTPKSHLHTKNYIINTMASLRLTSTFYLSMRCPLNGKIMKYPAKSINCNHLQCFDAEQFILQNEKIPRWKCPICNSSCSYDDLQQDSYFIMILNNNHIQQYSMYEIFVDGTYRASNDHYTEEIPPYSNILDFSCSNLNKKKKSHFNNLLSDLWTIEERRQFNWHS